MRNPFDYFRIKWHKPEPNPLPDEAVYKVLKVLRQNGISCFLVSDLLNPDIEKLIKGKG